MSKDYEMEGYVEMKDLDYVYKRNSVKWWWQE